MDAVAQLRASDSSFFWSQKITIQEVPGQGNSVVCVEPIDAGEVLIHVPASTLVNVDTIDIKGSNGDTFDTHELLAAELLRRRANLDPWVMAMPSSFSFLPVLWSTAEQQQLPERYLETVRKQALAIEAFAEKSRSIPEDAAWAWLAVNSRCLYWAKGGMTLAPAIDFLNHTADQKLGLSVNSTPAGMSVTSTHSYEPGSELTFCYGPRENGFLLVEYGFTLCPNIWEFVDVSKYVAPLVSKWREFLEKHGYYGDWTLDAAGEPCFRMEVALAAVQSPSPGPVKALINGFDDGQRFKAGTARLVGQIIQQALNDARAVYATTVNPQLKRLYEQYVQIMSNA